MVEPVVLGAAVATRGNDLLMMRTDRGAIEGCWSVPSVAVAGGETLVEAVVRAVRERCGLTALAAPLLGWYESIEHGIDGAVAGHDVVACYQTVVLDDSEPAPGPGVVEARWMPVWDVAELPLVDGLAHLLADHQVIDTIA